MIETVALCAGAGVAGFGVAELVRYITLSLKDNKLSAQEEAERNDIRKKLAESYFASGENRKLVQEIMDIVEAARNAPKVQDYANNYTMASVNAMKESLVQVLTKLAELKERV